METDPLLDRSQRQEILQAVAAIERQVKKVVGKADWQALAVIWTNLIIIRAQLIIGPRAPSN